MNAVINTKSVSFESIDKDLVAFAESQKDSDRPKDFLESSASKTISEWIAALGTFSAYQKQIYLRESNLETATMMSSVLELAADKGVLLAPGNSGTLTLKVRFNVKTTIVKGNFIGTISDYELYSLDTFTSDTGQDYEFAVVMGRLNSIERQINGFGPFAKYSFLLKDKYLANDFEAFYVEDDLIPLMSELNYNNRIDNNFALRACFPGEARIFAGNGILGFVNTSATVMRYNVLSYNDDLEAKMANPVNLGIMGSLLDKGVRSTPDYMMSKDDLKTYARYIPLDGRIVTDQDYKIMILKYFGGSIYDCYTYNSDPNQEVYLILKDGATDEDLKEIEEMVDLRRGFGIKVNYYVSTKDDGQTFSCSMTVPSARYDSYLPGRVKEYLQELCFKFMLGRTNYNTCNLSSDLSAYFGFPFKAADSNSIDLMTMDFLKDIEVNIIPKD